MKKNLILIAAALLLAVPAMNAQMNFGVGVNVGMEGGGVQFAAGITPTIQARVGYSYMPYSLIIGEQDFDFQAWDVHPSGHTTIKEQKIQGSGSLLVDFFLAPETKFHFTVGTMIGGGKMFQVTNTKPMPDSYHNSGMKYYPEGNKSASPTALKADGSGIYTAELRRNATRPYVGIGFGNPVAKGVSFTLDLGVQYTGGIGFYTDPNSNGNLDYRLDSDGVQQLAYDMRGSNTKKSYDKVFKYIDTLYKIPVMPVLRLSLMFGV